MDVVSGHVLQVQLFVQESLHLDGLLPGLPVRLLQPVSAQIAPPAAVVSTVGAALQILGRSSEAADFAAPAARVRPPPRQFPADWFLRFSFIP